MAQLTVVYWRHIPAQVIVKQGRQAAKRQLPERFEKAIDRAAMRANLRDTDSYLGGMAAGRSGGVRRRSRSGSRRRGNATGHRVPGRTAQSAWS